MRPRRLLRDRPPVRAPPGYPVPPAVLCRCRSALSAGMPAGEWPRPITLTIRVRVRFGPGPYLRRPVRVHDGSATRSSPDLSDYARGIPQRVCRCSPFDPASRIEGQSLPGGRAVPPFTMRGGRCTRRHACSCHRRLTMQPHPAYAGFEANGSHDGLLGHDRLTFGTVQLHVVHCLLWIVNNRQLVEGEDERSRYSSAGTAQQSDPARPRLSCLASGHLRGELAPGSRLIEEEVSAALGISRGPVREAIRQLESEGLLVTRSHRDTHVVNLSATDVAELYAVRAALEGFAASSGLETLRADHLDAMEDGVDGAGRRGSGARLGSCRRAGPGMAPPFHRIRA